MQVASTGHSGTMWLATALASAGVPATHEDRYRHDRAPAEADAGVVDVSWAATPFVTDTGFVFLTRDPLAVVRSLVSARREFLTEPTPAARFVAEHRPAVYDTPPDLIERAVAFAAWWRPTEDRCLSVRVEDGPVTLRRVASLAGFDVAADTARDVCDTLGSTVNSHLVDDPGISWDDVLRCRWGDLLACAAIASGYGVAA